MALLRGRYLGDEETAQILFPVTVMDNLLSTIFTVQTYVVAAVVFVGLATLLTSILVFLLSLRLRRREIETMIKIGGSRGILRSVHWEPDQIPADEEWKVMETTLAGHPARVMLWQGLPSAEITERLGGLGIESIVYDPGGNPPHQGDFLAVMRQNVQNLRRALQ